MEHPHQTIARLGLFALHICPAGPVTLTVGPVAISLQPEVLRQLRRFLELTQPKLEAALAAQSPAGPSSDLPFGWPPEGWDEGQA